MELTTSKSPFMTPQEAADYLRITKQTLYNLVYQQKITPIRMGNGVRARLLFKKAELDRYLGLENGD